MSRKKGPHSTFEAGVKAAAMMTLELYQPQPGGKWKYRPSPVDGSMQTDATIAAATGSTASWVSKHRQLRYPGGFIQQKKPRAPKAAPFVYPNAAAPATDGPTAHQIEAGAQVLHRMFSELREVILLLTGEITASRAEVTELKSYIKSKWD